MAQNNATVQFCYIPTNSSLPQSRDENTIYFDAANKGIYIGDEEIITKQTPQDLTNFVTETSAQVKHQIKMYDLHTGNLPNYIINGTSENRIYFSANDYTPTPLINIGIADPTELYDAATKNYVDTEIRQVFTPVWDVI